MATDEYRTRLERARDVTVKELRHVGNRNGVSVYEVDVVNEKGETRNCITLIPEWRYESTKDLQYRGESGVVGKYSLAAAMESDEVWNALVNEASDDLEETKDELQQLRTRKQNLEESIRHLRAVLRDEG